VTERPADLPEYAQEPLSEVAIGVLFDRLAGFRQGHFGRFWALVERDYPVTLDRERLEAVVEKLAPGPSSVSVALQLVESAPTNRAWFVSTDDRRLIQLQDDRLFVNWRRRSDGIYPRFETLRDEFFLRLGQFVQLMSDAGLKAVTPQQIELSYFNWIKDATPREFLQHPPALQLPTLGFPNSEDVMFTRFLVNIDNEPRAVLAVEVQPAQQVQDERLVNGYQLTLTYRRPLAPPRDGEQIRAALDDGRATIVRAFTELTSESMHQQWGRMQ
jgi:uncharacterized protein (TIGR04255 family)